MPLFYWIESKNKLQNLSKYYLLYILKKDLFKGRKLAVSEYKHLSSFYKYIFKNLNTIAAQKHTLSTTYLCETQFPSSQSHVEAGSWSTKLLRGPGSLFWAMVYDQISFLLKLCMCMHMTLDNLKVTLI